LRGFVEYFLDEANRQGAFNGRVVAVGSTGSGRDAAFGEQDGLYTLVTQGIDGGAAREEQRVVGSVSRALSATTEWDAVLACARNPWLELVFSNTTEVGIALDEGDAPDLAPPRSFPGKLTRFLFERARAFAFAPSKGVVVLPCELIEGNGDRLREIVLALAARWGLGDAFRRWVETSVPFCNTLVDRIVPGGLPETLDGGGTAATYRDALRTVCETYRLFAIEGDDALRARLGFAGADPGVLVAPDITPYRERKVRLLNGGHTISVPLALLAGCETVREAVEHPLVGAFVRRAMLEEIAPTLGQADAAAYAQAVLARFGNPFIRHALFDITLQGTMKMRVRVVPTIARHAERVGHAPDALALGFAAYLLFMRGELHERRRAAGLPVPADDQGDRVRALWAAHAPGPGGAPAAALDALVRAACADAALWGTDLARVPGFAEAVRDHLARLLADGVTRTLETHLAGATA
jgi:tagaturonate reductase